MTPPLSILDMESAINNSTRHWHIPSILRREPASFLLIQHHRLDTLDRVLHDVLLRAYRWQADRLLRSEGSNPDWIVSAHLRPHDDVAIKDILPVLPLPIDLQRHWM